MLSSDTSPKWCCIPLTQTYHQLCSQNTEGIIKLLTEQVQHRELRGFSLQWLRHLLTNGPLNQQFHLQRSETLAQVLSTWRARLVSAVLSTGSKETTFLDHRLKKATRQWLICLSSWAIFEPVIHSVCLTNNSFSLSFQPPSPTSRSLQNSTITLHTLEDETSWMAVDDSHCCC